MFAEYMRLPAYESKHQMPNQTDRVNFSVLRHEETIWFMPSPYACMCMPTSKVNKHLYKYSASVEEAIVTGRHLSRQTSQC